MAKGKRRMTKRKMRGSRRPPEEEKKEWDSRKMERRKDVWV